MAIEPLDIAQAASTVSGGGRKETPPSDESQIVERKWNDPWRKEKQICHHRTRNGNTRWTQKVSCLAELVLIENENAEQYHYS